MIGSNLAEKKKDLFKEKRKTDFVTISTYCNINKIRALGEKILIYLYRNTEKITNNISKSESMIADDNGCSERTVRRYLIEFQRLDLIKSVEHFTIKGKRLRSSIVPLREDFFRKDHMCCAKKL